MTNPRTNLPPTSPKYMYVTCTIYTGIPRYASVTTIENNKRLIFFTILEVIASNGSKVTQMTVHRWLILTANNLLNILLSVVSPMHQSLVLYFLLSLLMTCLMFPMFCSVCCMQITIVYTCILVAVISKGVFKGGGVQGVQTPPPEIFRFFFEK